MRGQVVDGWYRNWGTGMTLCVEDKVHVFCKNFNERERWHLKGRRMTIVGNCTSDHMKAHQTYGFDLPPAGKKLVEKYLATGVIGEVVTPVKQGRRYEAALSDKMRQEREEIFGSEVIV